MNSTLGYTLWKKIAECLEGHSECLTVARVLVENGLSIRNGRIYCNEIMIPVMRVSSVTKVDRRTVTKTIRLIEEDPELKAIFFDMKPAGASLKEVARHLKLGVIEITPINARTPGILAGSATLLANRNISIRQAIVNDPELSPEPKLVLIAEKKIPGDIIAELLKIDGVSKVSIY